MAKTLTLQLPEELDHLVLQHYGLMRQQPDRHLSPSPTKIVYQENGVRASPF